MDAPISYYCSQALAQPSTPAMQHYTRRIRLPGFGMELEQESILPIAQDWYALPVTVKERSMIALMLALKDKPNWHEKVFDENIVTKWRAEAIAFTPDHGRVRTSADRQDDAWHSNGGGNGQSLNMDGPERQKKIDKKTFDYCITELRDDARCYTERGFVTAIDTNAATFMSDWAISEETKTLLKEGVKPLENVRNDLKDWHPGSDEKVLDLVHPSLFPLVYGTSRILPQGQVPLEKCAWSTGEGDLFPEQACEERYSDNYQWLPCEVALDADQNASITSYINNLHPCDNEGLYEAIANVIKSAVPMWTETILSTRYLTGRRLSLRNPEGWIDKPKPTMIDEDGEEVSDDDEYYDNWDAYHEVEIPHPKRYTPRKRVNNSVFEAGPGSDRISNLTEPLHYPDTEPTTDQLRAGDQAMSAERSAIEKIFAEQGLQVIIKLANIHLTPEKPTYDGGSWHIEGQLNEHICASALYYYDSENITNSYLAFRETVDKDELNGYEQHRYRALMDIYGINDSWGDALQVLGAVHTREDRLLVFPNVLQHRVSPFELQNKSQPGHRKLLALFLVDPFIRIPSTANIPPQQIEWWRKAMEEKGSLTQRLPVELADRIVGEVKEGFPITMEEAKVIREDLIEERRQYVGTYEADFGENGYCFCEH